MGVGGGVSDLVVSRLKFEGTRNDGYEGGGRAGTKQESTAEFKIEPPLSIPGNIVGGEHQGMNHRCFERRKQEP